MRLLVGLLSGDSLATARGNTQGAWKHSMWFHSRRMREPEECLTVTATICSGGFCPEVRLREQTMCLKFVGLSMPAGLGVAVGIR